MKTSDLTGAALDWAVAKCEGWVDSCNGWLYQTTLQDIEEGDYKPSVNLEIGGRIIEREKINLECPRGTTWEAYVWIGNGRFAKGIGETLLIAAMRCYVQSKLGDEVQLPEEIK